MTGCIDGPYALDVRRKWTLSEQLLAYCSLNEKVLMQGVGWGAGGGRGE